MNLFEYLKNYKDPGVQQTYGDIINGTNDITENMNYIERMTYQQIKTSDRKRLIESGRISNSN